MPGDSATFEEVGEQPLHRLERRSIAEERRLVRHHRIEDVLLEPGITGAADALDEALEIEEAPLPQHRQEPGLDEVGLRCVDDHAAAPLEKVRQESELLGIDLQGSCPLPGHARPWGGVQPRRLNRIPTSTPS